MAVFADTVGVYDLWDKFLTHSRFSCYQNGQVGSSHLGCYIKSPVKQGTGPYYFKSLFNCCNIHLCKDINFVLYL